MNVKILFIILFFTLFLRGNAKSQGDFAESILRLKVHAVTSANKDGQKVKVWSDFGRNNHHLEHATASLLTIYRNTFCNLNFNSTIVFDGAIFYLIISPFAIRGNCNRAFIPDTSVNIKIGQNTIFASDQSIGLDNAFVPLSNASATLHYFDNISCSYDSSHYRNTGNLLKANELFLMVSASNNNASGNLPYYIASVTKTGALCGNPKGMNRAHIGAYRYSTFDIFDNYWNGYTSKVVVCPTLLIADQILTINSYFAMEYNFTTGTSVNPLYVSAGSTVFWNSDVTYQNNIDGIDRNDFSTLHEQQYDALNNCNLEYYFSELLQF